MGDRLTLQLEARGIITRLAWLAFAGFPWLCAGPRTVAVVVWDAGPRVEGADPGGGDLRVLV